MKIYNVTSTTYYFPKKGNYTKFKSDDLTGQNTYKLLYFFTEIGELGLINVAEETPESINSISNVFNGLIDEYNVPFHKKNRLRQDAWRYFTDKSESENIWHLHMMTGTPFKNKLTEDELYAIELVEKKELQVTPQIVTFDKWLAMDRDNQIKHMRLFLDNPVKGSDYILQNTFH